MLIGFKVYINVFFLKSPDSIRQCERSALFWKREVLNSGDWIEVEVLHSHSGYWTVKEGYGTVLKATGSGELTGSILLDSS
jgi:hypothetical protein